MICYKRYHGKIDKYAAKMDDRLEGDMVCLSFARAAGKKKLSTLIRFVKQLQTTSKQFAIYEPENSVFTI